MGCLGSKTVIQPTKVEVHSIDDDAQPMIHVLDQRMSIVGSMLPVATSRRVFKGVSFIEYSESSIPWELQQDILDVLYDCLGGEVIISPFSKFPLSKKLINDTVGDDQVPDKKFQGYPHVNQQTGNSIYVTNDVVNNEVAYMTQFPTVTDKGLDPVRLFFAVLDNDKKTTRFYSPVIRDNTLTIDSVDISKTIYSGENRKTEQKSILAPFLEHSKSGMFYIASSEKGFTLIVNNNGKDMFVGIEGEQLILTDDVNNAVECKK